MNKRRNSRTALHHPLHGEVTIPRAFKIIDLSVSGARVETADPLPVDVVRTFRLNLADQVVVVQGRVCHASVRTVRGTAVTYTSGIEFVEMSQPAHAALEEFLQSAVEIYLGERDGDGRTSAAWARSAG